MSSRTVLALTEGYQRAQEEAVGCWGGGGAIAVMEKRRGRAVAGEGYGGCYGAEVALLRAKEAGKTKKWALGVAGEHGRVKGAPWPAWPHWAGRR